MPLLHLDATGAGVGINCDLHYRGSRWNLALLHLWSEVQSHQRSSIVGSDHDIADAGRVPDWTRGSCWPDRAATIPGRDQNNAIEGPAECHSGYVGGCRNDIKYTHSARQSSEVRSRSCDDPRSNTCPGCEVMSDNHTGITVGPTRR